jgi:glycosyltransferase involved in cell wall biosynthesis
MKRPTLSLLVPTHREDRPLERCLKSVAPQLRDGDEVIVIGDTHDGSLPRVESLVERFGPKFRYLAVDAGHHCYGHDQLNAGIALAKGDYIHCNDDDDVWVPGALDTFRRAITSTDRTVPFLFRFKSYYGPIFWLQPGLFARNMIGGHCLLAPNVEGKLGAFSCDYSGDYDWVEATVDHYGGPREVVWVSDVIAVARPT